jgi:hypothetical protein
MIIWGGAGYVNTGGRYSPSSDSWTATSTASAPDGRERHTAVWTGNEMIVWGGYNHFYLNSGGRYCAAAANATATPTPTPRASPTPRVVPTPRSRPSPPPRP